MTHVEPVESRRLMANTYLDAAFGTAGALTLGRGLRAKNVLAASGAVYVDAYSKSDDARFLYKYDDRGRLDRGWGQGGRVTLHVFDTPARNDSKLVFEDRTGSVYVAAAALYVGGHELDIERVTAGGEIDSTFRTARVNLSGGPGTTGNLVTLLPQVHNKLLIAAEVKESFAGPGKATHGTEYVRLIRLSTDGTLDGTFNRKGFVSVFAGDFDTAGTGTRDVPTLSDLGGSFDGFYVVGLRNTYDYRFDGADRPTRSGTDVWSAEVATVRTDGSLVAEDARKHNLSHRPVVAATPSTIRFYAPLTARLNNGDAVDVLEGYRFGYGAPVTRISHLSIRANLARGSGGLDVPAGPTTLLPLFGRRGQTKFVRTGDVVTKLRLTYAVDRSWGRKGRIGVDAGVSLVGVDDDFRLLARSDDGRTVYRFDGGI